VKRGNLLRISDSTAATSSGKAARIRFGPIRRRALLRPRHAEISNRLAHKICRGLSVPDFGK